MIINYTVVNSNAMNGIGEGSKPYWVYALIAVDVVAVLGIGYGTYHVIRRVRKNEA